MKWYNWGTLIMAGWLIASPWILEYDSINLALWNSIIIGTLVGILTIWNLSR
jgi:hypothetical protein